MNCESEQNLDSRNVECRKELRTALLTVYRSLIVGLGIVNLRKFLLNKSNENISCGIFGGIQIISAVMGPFILSFSWNKIHSTEIGIYLKDIFVEKKLIGIKSNIES